MNVRTDRQRHRQIDKFYIHHVYEGLAQQSLNILTTGMLTTQRPRRSFIVQDK